MAAWLPVDLGTSGYREQERQPLLKPEAGKSSQEAGYWESTSAGAEIPFVTLQVRPKWRIS